MKTDENETLGLRSCVNIFETIRSHFFRPSDFRCPLSPVRGNGREREMLLPTSNHGSASLLIDEASASPLPDAHHGLFLI